MKEKKGKPRQVGQKTYEKWDATKEIFPGEGNL